jgi:hypothetical protein
MDASEKVGERDFQMAMCRHTSKRKRPALVGWLENQLCVAASDQKPPQQRYATVHEEFNCILIWLSNVTSSLDNVNGFDV